MINDLSETLRALLTQTGPPPELSAADISFERPIETFKPEWTTVNAFLYELRENHDLRSNGKEATLSLACSYLITAWPAESTEPALKEQQLLGQALQVLSGHRVIPASLLKGSLVGRSPPPMLQILPPDAIKNASEFWTALGNKFRLSFSVTVTIALPVDQRAETPP
jgi:hypothetical protein